MNPIRIEASSKRPGVMANIDCLKKEMQVQQIGGDAISPFKNTIIMSPTLCDSLASLSQMEKTSSREDDISEDLEEDLRAYGWQTHSKSRLKQWANSGPTVGYPCLYSVVEDQFADSRIKENR